MSRVLRFAGIVVAALSLLLLIRPLAAQQINPGTNSGLPPFGSFHGSEFDQVNLSNGNLHIEIPIVSVKQRGGKVFTWKYVYDSPEFTNQFFPEPLPNNPTNGVYQVSLSPTDSVPNSGWRLVGPFDFGGGNVETDDTCPSTGMVYVHDYAFYITDPSGTKHPLALNMESDGSCQAQILSGPTLDGTGMIDNIQSGPLTLKDGTQLGRDTNGNLITTAFLPIGEVKDTLNRIPVTITNGTGYTIYAVVDSSGTSQTYRVDFETIPLSTDFCAHTLRVFGTSCFEDTDTMVVPQKLTLPNGKTYLFTYNTAGWGELTRVDLPTGGFITYTYQDTYAIQPVQGDGDTQPSLYGRRGAITRIVTNGSNVQAWTYTLGFQSPYVSTVIDPLGNKEVRSMPPIGGSSVESQVKYFDPSGNLLRTVDKVYASETDPTNTANQINVRLIRETTTLDNGLVSKKETDYETFSFNCLGRCPGTATRLNPTETREYDYGAAGSGTFGPLLRRTDYTYLHTGNSTYTNLNIVNRPTSIIVYNGSSAIQAQTQMEYDSYTAGLTASGAVQHDATFSTTYLTRGNLTATKRWRNTDGAWLTARNQYDDAGNILSTTDPLGHTNSFSYADTWTAQTGGSTCAPTAGPGKAYVTQTTDALGHTTASSFYSCTGFLGSATDNNSQTTTVAYDLFGRTTSAQFPSVAGAASFTYDDTALTVTTSRTRSAGASIYSKEHYDALGRLTQDEFCEDGTSACATSIKTDHTYDQVDRESTTSNPHRTATAPTDGITTTIYDALGRICVVVPPDGTLPTGGTCPATQPTNTIFTTYSGNTTTVTDQAGHRRKSVTDGLGRLSQVFEDPAVLNLETDYTYDTLDNLLAVNQKGGSAVSGNWRTRTFTYNSLSQLLTASNPESGTATYAYDADGNLINKTSPAPNQTASATVTLTYCYDALHRMTAKGSAFSPATPQVCSATPPTLPTPIATYVYDTQPGWGVTLSNPIGRMTEQYTGPLATVQTASIFSYDAVGRVLLNNQCTPSNCGTSAWPFSYTYDLAGDMLTGNNGVGVTFSYSYDPAARPAIMTSSFVDGQHPATLATVDPTLGYYASGAIRKITYGNSLTETEAYNNRLQPCRYNVNSSASALGSCTDTSPSGTVQDYNYGFNAGTANNGNIMSMVGTGNQIFNRSYTYDALNRLSTTADSATAQACKGLSWTYDAWGNRTDQTVTAGTCNPFHSAVDTNNRLSGAPYAYDVAGNMTHDASHSYTYDAENHLIQVDGTPGTCSTATACYIYDAAGRRVRKNTGTTSTEYLYSLSGNVAAEWRISPGFTGWSIGYIYLGSSLIAEYENATTNFIHKDHLGSTRLVTSLTRTVTDSMDYLPFGEQIAGSSTSTHKFTGKERDAESNLDNFGARYDSSSLGRFMSVDPSRNSINPINPQSWNRYLYVLNNTLANVDRNGLWPTYIHDEIYEAVFGGTLTPQQIKLIEKVSANQDAILKGGQDPKNSNQHAQCAPGQSMTACTKGIADHITVNLAKAKAVGDVQGLSKLALTYFATAAHTLTDMGSPSHAAPDGTPTTWNGIFGRGAIPHVFGEMDEALDWYGIGQSVRNLVGGFIQSFPEDASKLGNPNAAIQRAIEKIVDNYFSNPNLDESNQLERELARQCALGNRAGCN
ncbi:MAG TPA: RHS repeat-associated core domain-containing protein [Candidatus Acidoferrum sp.]